MGFCCCPVSSAAAVISLKPQVRWASLPRLTVLPWLPFHPEQKPKSLQVPGLVPRTSLTFSLALLLPSHRHVPTSGPLHLLCPFPGNFNLQVFTWLILS